MEEKKKMREKGKEVDERRRGKREVELGGKGWRMRENIEEERGRKKRGRMRKRRRAVGNQEGKLRGGRRMGRRKDGRKERGLS